MLKVRRVCRTRHGWLEQSADFGRALPPALDGVTDSEATTADTRETPPPRSSSPEAARQSSPARASSTSVPRLTPSARTSSPETARQPASSLSSSPAGDRQSPDSDSLERKPAPATFTAGDHVYVASMVQVKKMVYKGSRKASDDRTVEGVCKSCKKKADSNVSIQCANPSCKHPCRHLTCLDDSDQGLAEEWGKCSL